MLKNQSGCQGVYAIVPGRLQNGLPVYKHTTADLCLTSAKVEDEDGWVIAQWTTLGTKEHRCMRARGKEFPFADATSGWQEWNGREWEAAATVKCRPSYHGWGQDGGEQCVHNSESAVLSARRAAPRHPSTLAQLCACARPRSPRHIVATLSPIYLCLHQPHALGTHAVGERRVPTLSLSLAPCSCVCVCARIWHSRRRAPLAAQGAPEHPAT